MEAVVANEFDRIKYEELVAELVPLNKLSKCIGAHLLPFGSASVPEVRQSALSRRWQRELTSLLLQYFKYLQSLTGYNLKGYCGSGINHVSNGMLLTEKMHSCQGDLEVALRPTPIVSLLLAASQADLTFSFT